MAGQITLAALLRGCAGDSFDEGIRIDTELVPLAAPGGPVKPAVYEGGTRRDANLRRPAFAGSCIRSGSLNQRDSPSLATTTVIPRSLAVLPGVGPAFVERDSGQRPAADHPPGVAGVSAPAFVGELCSKKSKWPLIRDRSRRQSAKQASRE